MFRKMEQPNPQEEFYSYGFTGMDAAYQKKFHDEDALVELIKNKSGLIDKNSTIRTFTNMKENTIEFQLHYEYANNEDKFVSAMKDFLNSATKKDLDLSFQMKETMQFCQPYPVLTMDRDHMQGLISELKKIEPKPHNDEILNGDRRIRPTVCLF